MLPSGQPGDGAVAGKHKGSGSGCLHTGAGSGMSDKQMDEDAKLVMKDLAALKKAVEG
jgi:hypothetical protein